MMRFNQAKNRWRIGINPERRNKHGLIALLKVAK